MEWQTIETAPMQTDVLVAFSTIVGEARCLATNSGPQWFWANTDPSDHWANAIYPTHWQPLPPPPRADDGGPQ